MSPKKRGGMLLFVLDKMPISDSIFCILVFCLRESDLLELQL